MPQRTDTGSRAETGYVQTPCRGNETLTDTWGLWWCQAQRQEVATYTWRRN